jgi:WD40 repeat protein
MHLPVWLSLFACGVLLLPPGASAGEPSQAAGQKPGDRGKAPRTDLYGDPLPEGAVARLGTIRLRHCSGVDSVTFTPDGKSLVAADSGHGSDGKDSHICIYDPTTGAQVRSFLGDPFGNGTLALSPDGKLLAGIGGAHSVSLWDMATGRSLREFRAGKEGDGSILMHLAFSPDGKTLTTIGNTLTPLGGASGIQLWDVATGERVRRLAGMENGWHVAYSPDGKLLAAGGEEGLQLWDVATGKMAWQIKSASGIHAAAFSPDGKTLAVGDEAGLVLLVAPADGKEVRRWQAHAEINNLNRSTQSVAFSPDGKTLASGGDDGLIYLWDPLTGKKTRALRGHVKTVSSVAFSPDGRTLASGSYDRTVRLWDVATGRGRVPLPGHRDLIWDFALAPDGKSLATAGDDKTLRLWDVSSGKEERQPITVVERPHSLVYAPDGRSLAFATGGGQVHVCDPRTGKERFGSHIPERWVTVLACSAGGTVLAYARDHDLRLWRAGDGGELWRVRPGEAESIASHLALSPDGRTLASDFSVAPDKHHEEGGIRLLDARTGQEVRRLSRVKDDFVDAFAFSPDGGTLAASYSHAGMELSLWDPSTGCEKGRLGEAALTINHLAFSPDGRFLAASGQDDTIRIWELAAGRRVRRLRAAEDGIGKVAYTPDGRRLVSLGHSTLLVWDATGLADTVVPKRLDARELQDLWDALAGGDAPRACGAVWRLAAAPEQAVAFLGERLRPVPAVDPKDIARRIADLDDDDFAVRQRGAEELGKLGERAAVPLRAALEAKPSPEARRRLEKLVEAAEVPFASGAPLRELRAAAVLEYAGTPDARQVLETLAGGAPDARLTRDAKAALKRLTPRIATP